MSDPVVQWQIVATHPDELVKFYRELFGWTITTKNAMGSARSTRAKTA